MSSHRWWPAFGVSVVALVVGSLAHSDPVIQELNPSPPGGCSPGGGSFDGPGDSWVTICPGNIAKNGQGTLRAKVYKGRYRVEMDGPGNFFMYGLNSYAGVVVRKNGPGNLIWVPNNKSRPNSGPSIEFQDGPGQIRRGEWTEIVNEPKGKMPATISDDLNPLPPEGMAAGATLNGPAPKDISIGPGAIVKDGPGLLLAMVFRGPYALTMNGPGDVYLFGLNDYSQITITKDGPGNLYWCANDVTQPFAGPRVVAKNGPGAIARRKYEDAEARRGS